MGTDIHEDDRLVCLFVDHPNVTGDREGAEPLEFTGQSMIEEWCSPDTRTPELQPAGELFPQFRIRPDSLPVVLGKLPMPVKTLQNRLIR